MLAASVKAFGLGKHEAKFGGDTESVSLLPGASALGDRRTPGLSLKKMCPVSSLAFFGHMSLYSLRVAELWGTVKGTSGLSHLLV